MSNHSPISSPTQRTINKRLARLMQSELEIAKRQSTSFGKLILGDERNSPVISTNIL